MLFAAVLMAQDVPKVELFGGYGYTSVDTKGSGLGRQSFNGWDADFAARISKNVAIVGDISGSYKTETIDLGGVSASAKLKFYNYLFGPRVSAKAGKVNPFVEALFGIGHVTASAESGGVTGSVSSNGFAMAFGGGLDVSANKNISIRVAKFDYILNRVENADLGFTPAQNLNNFRIATGVVFKF